MDVVHNEIDTQLSESLAFLSSNTKRDLESHLFDTRGVMSFERV